MVRGGEGRVVGEMPKVVPRQARRDACRILFLRRRGRGRGVGVGVGRLGIEGRKVVGLLWVTRAVMLLLLLLQHLQMLLTRVTGHTWVVSNS
jgi:hypothetical protein